MPRAQNIAIVCPRFAEGNTTGGAETLLRRLAERLLQSGRNVTFLTTCAKDHFTWNNELPPGAKKVGDLEVIYFPVNTDRNVDLFLRIQASLGGGRKLSAREELDWITNSVTSQALYDHLREQGAKYDRILAGPYLFGLTYFASLIHPERTFLVPCLHDESFAYLDIMRKMFSGVAGCLFNTLPEQELACNLYGLPAEKCTIVGMGLDAFEADSGAFAARHNLRNPYVIYSGRREGGKGTPLITSYMNLFRHRTGREIDLVFTGTGHIEAPDELRHAIHDFGFVSETEKHEAMAGAVAFIHPSVFESLGIVLLESFLAGTPALVHANSAVLRWQCKRSGAGLWFANYAEFEEELLLLSSNSALRAGMGGRGREFVRREYDWQTVETRLLQALER